MILRGPESAEMVILREIYHESFALIQTQRADQIYLFVVRGGQWALVWTFTTAGLWKIGIREGDLVNGTLNAIRSIKGSSFYSKLDYAVAGAIKRVAGKRPVL